MKKICLFLFLLPYCLSAQKEDTAAIRFSNYITSEGMKKNLMVLASDEYEGRETGQKGQKMSAAYISNYYKDLGIAPLESLKEGYQQEYSLSVYNPQTVKMSLGKKTFKQNADFYSWSAITGDTNFTIFNIEFCGYGINTLTYNDYDKTDLKGKAVMILNGEPYKEDGKSWISKKLEASHWSQNYRMKLNEAKKQGVKYLFIADKNLNESYTKEEHRITAGKMTIDKNMAASYPLIIYVSNEMANELLSNSGKKITVLADEISRTGKSIQFNIKTELSVNLKQEKTKLTAENVMAYMEGSDLKDELVVMSAHYDHLGVHNGKVFNGADDDGSGTVAVMQLAKAFEEAKKQGKGPKRSLLFLNVSGEEKGLLGSDYYTQHPVFELSKTVADLNIDMIGRLDETHKNDPNYIYVIGDDKLSTELHQISETVNNTYTHLKLDYTYNDENDPNRFYYRSDHYNFAKNNVPVIFYFNGVHEDYHEETDEVQKIDFTKMEKITKLVFFTAWQLANQPNRIKVDVKK